MKEGDRIIRKDGKWRKGRFATVVAIGNNGDILARFGSMGKYFGGWAKNYITIQHK